MFFGVRVLLILASIPGVIVHELGHQVFCHLTGTRVLKVCYFRFGIPAGYVMHERPRSLGRHLLISLGPFFVNTTASFAFGYLAWGGHFFGNSVWVAKLLPLWLATAIGMHAFPSLGDAESFLDGVWAKGSGLFAKVLGTPVAMVLFLGAFLGNYGLDVIFGVGVGLVGPWCLQHHPEWLRGLF